MNSNLKRVGAGIATVSAAIVLNLAAIGADAAVGTQVERLCLGSAIDEDCFVPQPQTNAAVARGRRLDSTPTGAAAFCQAALAAEASAVTGDPAVIEPAFDAVSRAAPAEVKAAVDTVIASFIAGEEGSPDFDAAYGDLIGYVKTNCGFATLTVTATEYAFDGLPNTFDAGPVVIDFDNSGAEFHMLSLHRVNDGVTETLDELLALPEDDFATKVTEVGGAFAAPREVGYGMLDLQPGRYIAICLLPIGATPENMPQIESGEHDGAPHFTSGMIEEFNVV
jgi:hypothetical protein